MPKLIAVSVQGLFDINRIYPGALGAMRVQLNNKDILLGSLVSLGPPNSKWFSFKPDCDEIRQLNFGKGAEEVQSVTCIGEELDVKKHSEQNDFSLYRFSPS